MLAAHVVAYARAYVRRLAPSAASSVSPQPPRPPFPIIFVPLKLNTDCKSHIQASEGERDREFAQTVASRPQMREALAAMSSEEAKLFLMGTFTKWQTCTLLSWFWPGAHLSCTMLYQAGVQHSTLVEALYQLLAHDADERTLW